MRACPHSCVDHAVLLEILKLYIKALAFRGRPNFSVLQLAHIFVIPSLQNPQGCVEWEHLPVWQPCRLIGITKSSEDGTSCEGLLVLVALASLNNNSSARLHPTIGRMTGGVSYGLGKGPRPS